MTKHAYAIIASMCRCPEALPCRATLSDGEVLVVRELHADDEPALRAWFATLSNQARFERFHRHVADLSPAHWRYLTRIDGTRHIAILALLDGGIAGVGRMIRLDGDDTAAEISFLVGDEVQRRGIGSVLRDVLLDLARSHSYKSLHAYVLRDNLAIRRLLTRSGTACTDRGDVLELRL